MNGNIPVTHDYMNGYNSEISPSTIHACNTELSYFFKRYLFQKAFSPYEIEIPETWARNYFLYSIFGLGYIAILETDKYGVIPQHCGLRGYDIFYQPTHASITNPLLYGILTPRIGKQCSIIKLQQDWGGISDLVGFYADMMAICAETAGLNLFNSKLSYVFGAGNKASAESFKKLFDKISSGEPAVVIDKDLFNDDGSQSWGQFSQNVGQNYIAGSVLEDMRKLELMFLSQIGINNANTNKKERLTTDEVNANNEEVKTLVQLWYEEMKSGFDKTNKMFGLNLKIKLRESEKNEIDNVNTRAL